MLKRVLGIVTIALMSICSTAPASANILASARASANCSGYTIVVQGFDLHKPSTVTYKITLTSPAGASTVSGAIPVKPERNGHFQGSQTETWASFGLTLNNSYNLSGTATLLSSGSTVNIVFAPPTLTCFATSCTTGAISNFNNNSFPSSSTIWFNSVFNLSGMPQSGAQLAITNSTITYQSGGQNYTINGPGASIVFSPNVNLATTSFANNVFNTMLPTSHLAGNEFATGAIVPAPSGPPAGTQNIQWNVTFSSPNPNLSVKWQWAAAVYSSFSNDYNAIEVKPVDDNQASQYKNSDHAGTPEAFKPYVIGGARGGGGSNWTGSYSGTASCALVPQGNLRFRR